MSPVKSPRVLGLVAAAVVIAVIAAVLLVRPPGGPTPPPATPVPTLTGGGSSFAAPQVLAWARKFGGAHGMQVNYQPVGSGAGVSQLLDKRLDFALSDVPLRPKIYGRVRGRVFQFPVTAGPLAIVYNVPEIARGTTHKCLNITAEIIAQIYAGNITSWCDERIRAVNPGLKLPCERIVPVYRADASGSTALLTLYLSRTNPAWNRTVGWGYTVKWPVEGIGAKGSEGMTRAVLGGRYSIGYVEVAYWLKNREEFDRIGGVACVRNDNDGRYYAPEPSAAVLGLRSGLERYVRRHGGMPSPDGDWAAVAVEMSNPPEGYPLASPVYAVLWKDYAAEGYSNAAERSSALRKFFAWVLTEGQRPENVVEGYVPLPEELARIGLQAAEALKP
ncbi:MAG: phosphate ABC transporter substrate-binding protein PstS [Thermoproteaceae archaeon]|nr:phosphate ABC transporter substrate-binding protein PstS [Thermoproteaceae archaeon]